MLVSKIMIVTDEIRLNNVRKKWKKDYYSKMPDSDPVVKHYYALY